jgi:plasmid stabilization system protein ParE
VARVLYTPAARTDLLEAWLFVAEENLAAADRMVDTIEHEIDLLAHQPLMGKERPELHSQLRSWPTSTPHIVFYIPESNGITVIRLLHHARDVQNTEL